MRNFQNNWGGLFTWTAGLKNTFFFRYVFSTQETTDDRFNPQGKMMSCISWDRVKIDEDAGIIAVVILAVQLQNYRNWASGRYDSMSICLDKSFELPVSNL